MSSGNTGDLMPVVLNLDCRSFPQLDFSGLNFKPYLPPGSLFKRTCPVAKYQ